MSMSHTIDRCIPHHEAYPLIQRRAHAEQHVILAAELGFLETTQSHHIARTYGLPDSFINQLKVLKARFRNELSFGGGK
jgi:hypothetical protein